VLPLGFGCFKPKEWFAVQPKEWFAVQLLGGAGAGAGPDVVRNLHAGCVCVLQGEAQLCILAEDCNQPDYKKLIEALCAEHNVNLIRSATATGSKSSSCCNSSRG
jgi:hypothetical protein